MSYNQNMLDTLSVLSFIMGIANYNENLTQSDKDDLMKGLDQKTNEMLMKIEQDLEDQNCMLKEILRRMDDGR